MLGVNEDIPLWLLLCKGHSGTRSRTPKRYRKSRSRSRSRSRSQSRSFDRKSGVWRNRSRSRSPKRPDRPYIHGRELDRRRRDDWRGRRSRSPRFHRRRSRSRSRSRERFNDRERERARFRGRSSRSRSQERENDLRVKIDKAKLRQIAIQNAYRNMATGTGPVVNLKPDQLAALKAGGKSVEELTNFCKKISEKKAAGESSDEDQELYARRDSEDESFTNHPFKLKDSQAPIVMNIRNAKQLPTASFADRTAQSANLRLQFPVSSGSHHRAKEWVPVEPTTAPKTMTVAKITTSVAATGPSTTITNTASTAPATATDTATTTTTAASVSAPAAAEKGEPTPESVFPDMPPKPLNIGELVTERISAMRKLQDNPLDLEAMTAMFKAQQQMNQWATPLPGQFTGTTGVQILSQEQLSGVDKKHQAWLKKDQFSKAAPVKGGIGMFLLKKMGWQEGTGLGKTQEGSLEPLMLDVKTDRRGLSSTGESQKKAPTVAVQARAKDLSGKHPVSALMELCSRRKWGSPEFLLVHESGPDHKKNFLYKVKINNHEYQPSVASNTKKLARAQAAAAVLQELGLMPKDN